MGLELVRQKLSFPINSLQKETKPNTIANLINMAFSTYTGINGHLKVP